MLPFWFLSIGFRGDVDGPVAHPVQVEALEAFGGAAGWETGFVWWEGREGRRQEAGMNE